MDYHHFPPSNYCHSVYPISRQVVPSHGPWPGGYVSKTPAAKSVRVRQNHLSKNDMKWLCASIYSIFLDIYIFVYDIYIYTIYMYSNMNIVYIYILYIVYTCIYIYCMYNIFIHIYRRYIPIIYTYNNIQYIYIYHLYI